MTTSCRSLTRTRSVSHWVQVSIFSSRRSAGRDDQYQPDPARGVCVSVPGMKNHDLSRRTFLAMAGAMPFAASLLAQTKKVPVGLELYSVRGELKKDPKATVTAVAKMGYEVVEFY